MQGYSVAVDSEEPESLIAAVINEGRRQSKAIQEVFPDAMAIDIAGGAIVDLDDATVDACLKSNPSMVIEHLSDNLEPVKTVLAASKASRPEANAASWNYEQSGASWLKENGMFGDRMRLGVISMDYPWEHPALAGRIKNAMKFGLPPKARTVADLHLLHPLGIFGGYEEGRFSGIAPEAEIYLAMLSPSPTKTDALLEALDWLVKQPEPPHAILICTDFAAPAPLAVARALFACRNAGILPILAAGNNPNTITGMAALPCCVTVSATDRWQQRALFSGQGPVAYSGQKIVKPDFCEPGSAVAGPAEGKEYRLGSGTLQAAAHFAGVYLLMRQALPDTDPEILLNAIRFTSQDIDITGVDDATGYGIPVPAAAISYVNTPPASNNNCYR